KKQDFQSICAISYKSGSDSISICFGRKVSKQLCCKIWLDVLCINQEDSNDKFRKLIAISEYAKQNGDIEAAEILTIFYKVKDVELEVLHHFIIVGKKSYFSGKYNLLVPAPEEKHHFDVEYDRSGFAGWKIEYNNKNIGVSAIICKIDIDKKHSD
ncbi:12168_t:CDS:2, partial [Gigaspora rosea]